MSQILDAINKAEQQRQKRNEEKTSREDLYQSLKQPRYHSRRLSWLPLAAITCLLVTGLGFAAYRQQWFFNTARPQTDHEQTDHEQTEGKKTAGSSIAQQLTTPDATSVTSPATTSPITATPSQQNNTKQQRITQHITRVAKPSKTQLEGRLQGQLEDGLEGELEKGKPHPKLTTLTPIAVANAPNKLVELTPIKTQSTPTSSSGSTTAKASNGNPAQKTVSNSKQASALRPQVSRGKAPVDAPPESQAKAENIATSATASWKKNIHITAIVYHQNPHKRFALIRGKKIYEGQTIPDSNTIVVKILQQGLIINDGSGDTMIR